MVSVYTVNCTVGFIWQILCLCFRSKIRISDIDPSKPFQKLLNCVQRFFADLVIKTLSNEIKKFAEAPVCHYGSNESTLAFHFEMVGQYL